METLEAKIIEKIKLRMSEKLDSCDSIQIAEIIDQKLDDIAHNIVDDLEDIWGL